MRQREKKRRFIAYNEGTDYQKIKDKYYLTIINNKVCIIIYM